MSDYRPADSGYTDRQTAATQRLQTGRQRATQRLQTGKQRATQRLQTG